MNDFLSNEQGCLARRAALFAVVLATAVGCTDAGSSHHADRSPSVSQTPSATAARLPEVPSAFGGWDTNIGAQAFRLDWTVTSAGEASGVLDLVTQRPHGHERDRFRVSGSVTAPRPNGRMPVRLRMDHGIFGVRRLIGYVDDGRVLIHAPYSSSLEMDLYGSSVHVDREFRRHVRIINGPGGYEGWLRRRAARQTIVRHVDMNGDGRLDLVTVVWVQLPRPRIGQGTRRVFVRLSDGRIYDVAVPAMNISSASRRARLGFGGIVRLPGLSGHQIVLDYAQGASNAFYDVVGVAGGRLGLIPPPPFHSSWVTGGTIGTGSEDLVCQGETLGVTRVTYPPHHRDKQRLTLKRYRWSDSGWLLISTVRRLAKPPRLERLLRRSGEGLWGCR